MILTKASFKIVIPTRDSAPWIVLFLEAYRRLGLEPLYIVDTRCVDDTISRLTAVSADIALFEPHSDYVEAGMIGFAATRNDCEWTLRMDDDEFPSKALLRWIEAEGIRRREPVWAFSRYDLMRRGSMLVFNRHRSMYFMADNPNYLNPQFRFFRHREIEICEEVHTSGFRLSNKSYAPKSAVFAHFDILLRSPAERLEKVRRYEIIKPKHGWSHACQYLPELFPDEDLNAGLIDITDFDALVADISMAPPNESVTLSFEEIKTLVGAEHHGSVFPRDAKIERFCDRIPDYLIHRRVGELLCTIARLRTY